MGVENPQQRQLLICRPGHDLWMARDLQIPAAPAPNLTNDILRSLSLLGSDVSRQDELPILALLENALGGNKGAYPFPRRCDERYPGDKTLRRRLHHDRRLPGGCGDVIGPTRTGKVEIL